MSLYKFSNFIQENIDLKELSRSDFNKIKDNLIKNLEYYKDSLLSKIHYNTKTNKIEYLGFDNIDVSKELSNLIKLCGEDVINLFNVESFLRKMYQIIDLKKRSTKKRIRFEFKDYYNSLEDRYLYQNKFNDIEEQEYNRVEGEKSIIPRRVYEDEKFDIQVELLKLQEWVVQSGKRIAIVFEGRDSAGKGSTIKRFIEHLNPKHFRVVALGIPTDAEKNNWLQRYEQHMPKKGEIVFFDRSWYNRAVVDPALGYCTEDQYLSFMEDVLEWEENMIKNGLILIKFWFSISKEKQRLRFDLRKSSPLKYWKFSPNDAKVVDKWEVITFYKNQMFNKTSSNLSPWVVINTNDKRIGRLNSMRYVLDVTDYKDKDSSKSKWYPEVINIIK